jgi:hypothetical protein
VAGKKRARIPKKASVDPEVAKETAALLADEQAFLALPLRRSTRERKPANK